MKAWKTQKTQESKQQKVKQQMRRQALRQVLQQGQGSRQWLSQVLQPQVLALVSAQKQELHLSQAFAQMVQVSLEWTQHLTPQKHSLASAPQALESVQMLVLALMRLLLVVLLLLLMMLLLVLQLLLRRTRQQVVEDEFGQLTTLHLTMKKTMKTMLKTMLMTKTMTLNWPKDDHFVAQGDSSTTETTKAAGENCKPTATKQLQLRT